MVLEGRSDKVTKQPVNKTRQRVSKVQDGTAQGRLLEMTNMDKKFLNGSYCPGLSVEGRN